MKKNKHLGSSFDEFLKKEGLDSDVAARAAKRTFAHQLEKKMLQNHKNKFHLRKALGSPTTTERLFSDSTGISLETMVKAAYLVGCDLEIHLVNRTQDKVKRRI